MIQNTMTLTLLSIGQTAVAFSAPILMNSFFYYKVEIDGDLNIFKEDQLMENFQVFLIFIAGLTCIQGIFTVEKHLRLFPLAGALLSLSFILRELDVEKFDVPQFIAFLFGSGYGKKTLLISLWLVVVYRFVRNHRHYKRIALTLLGQRSGVLAVTGGLMLILGGLFDDRVFNMDLYQFYEELSEMNGYYLFLLSSFYLIFDLKRIISLEHSPGTELQRL